MTSGDNLQAIRKQKKISQEKLAEELGVSRQTVGKWETGAAYPETEHLIHISDFFDVSLDLLVKGDMSRGNFLSISSEEETDTRRQDNGTHNSECSESDSRVSAEHQNKDPGTGARAMRIAFAAVLFAVSPFIPGETGAGGISSFFMILCIAVGIGLLLYNYLSKKKEDEHSSDR